MVADLGNVSAILGMDFLKAYDAEISLKRDTVSFRAGTVINALWEEGPDCETSAPGSRLCYAGRAS